MDTTLTSTNTNRDPLLAWLIRQLQSEEEGCKVDRITLAHLDVMDHGDHMDTFEVRHHSPDAAASFISQIRYYARADAEVRGGQQRYAVQCHFPADKSIKPRYHAFSVDGTAVRNTEIGGSTEPANLEGHLKQLMRHNETLMKMATQQTVDILAEHQRDRARLINRIETLEEGRFKVLEVTEGMLNAQAEREIEAARAAAQDRRRDAALGEFQSLIPLMKPALLKLVSGKPDGNAPYTQMMKNVFEGCTMEQLKEFMATLPAEKQPLFVQLYSETMGIPKPEKKADADAESDDQEPAAH